MKIHMDAKIPHSRDKFIYPREAINELKYNLILTKRGSRDLQKHHIYHLSVLTKMSARP